MEEKIGQVIEKLKLHQVTEKAIQVAQKEQQVSETHIPREIVNKILYCLPLKPLARFMCVSKLWSSLITPILRQRLGKEIARRVSKCNEAVRTLAVVMKEVNGRVVDVDKLRACHVRVKAKIDDMMSVMDFDQDFLNAFPEALKFRDHVIPRVRGAEVFLSKIDFAMGFEEAEDFLLNFS